MNIASFLSNQNVQFELITHRDTYDAQRMAATLHVSGCDVAKTVLLRADSGFAYVVAVLPANKNINLQRASDVLGGSHLELATEVEVSEHCPDCEPGALPPFGSQYGMKTVVDKSLLREEIVFEGNTHHESIRMSLEDFRRIEEPHIGDFAD